LIAYIPSRAALFSKRKFIPMSTIPAEWNLSSRIPINPRSTASTTPPNPTPPVVRNVIVQSGAPLTPSFTSPIDGATLDSSTVVNEEGGGATTEPVVTSPTTTPQSPLLYQEGGLRSAVQQQQPTSVVAVPTSGDARAMVQPTPVEPISTHSDDQ
jgi:hypothetical protein